MEFAHKQAVSGSTSVCTIKTDSGKPGIRGKTLLYLDPKNAHPRVSGLRAAGWQVDTASNLTEFQSLSGDSKAHVGVVRLDSNTDHSELGVIATILSANRDILWIALLSDDPAGKPATAALISHYCYDFFIYPFNMEHLQMTLNHACGMARLWTGNIETTETVAPLTDIVGDSETMQLVYNRIRKIAAVSAPALLIGESGTGKELTANAIHQLSRRKDNPFVAVNCAALPAELIQSELFGHEKGAFTGAHHRHIGRFEAANGGTIFLDEISDLPLKLQINLLRFLEEQEIERVGSTNSIAIDARVIAASHEDLDAAVKAGRFREDLYYRLNVLQLPIPRLCERMGDIPLLAEYAFKHFSSEIKPRARGFSRAALQAMQHYAWPGNVRELNNLVCRAMVMAEGRMITPADLGLEDINQQLAGQTLDETCMHAARHAIEAGLRRTRNNVSQTARELGISRTTLYRWMEKIGTEVV
ncbi:MAG: sigma-54 dependent transcriptional regulator [Pseudomonadota bacterium]